MVSLILKTCKNTFGTGKTLVFDIGFCVDGGITELESKGIYSRALMKNKYYFPKEVPGGFIDNNVQNWLC